MPRKSPIPSLLLSLEAPRINLIDNRLFIIPFHFPSLLKLISLIINSIVFGFTLPPLITAKVRTGFP